MYLGEKQEVPLFRTTSIESDKDSPIDSARLEYDRRDLSSLDDITQPISHHPPARTHRDQEHTATVIKKKIFFRIDFLKIHLVYRKKNWFSFSLIIHKFQFLVNGNFFYASGLNITDLI